jgi:hypothetical protein
MSTINDSAKSLPLPLFDGAPTKFKSWWMKIKSYATITNFAQAIQRTAKADLPPTEDADVSSDNKKRLARQRNLMAISCLTMAFSDDALLNMVEQSETSDWPSGLAYTIFDELFKKYRPDDIISRVELRSKLSNVTMKADEDPRTLFNQLASIQSVYNNAARKIDQDDLIAVVLEKAPEKYKSILTAEQRSKGANLTLTDLNSCMHDLYRTLQSGKKNKETEDTEVLLTATTMQLHGKCGYCKKTGHMAKDCRSKKADQDKGQSNSSKSMRPCKHCGGNISTSNAGSYYRTPKVDQPIGNQGKEMKQSTSHKIISSDLESNYISIMSTRTYCPPETKICYCIPTSGSETRQLPYI